MDENELAKKFKEIVQNNEFKILLELSKDSPDFIISFDEKKIGVELKSDAGSGSLARAMGQLLFGKAVFNLDELWLIIPDIKSLIPPISKEWFTTFRSNNVKIFSLQDDMLVEITEDMIGSSSRFIFLISRIDKKEEPIRLRPRLQELVQLIKDANEISFTELATRLQITEDAVRGMVSIVVRAIPEIERFKKGNRGWVRYKPVNQS